VYSIRNLIIRDLVIAFVGHLSLLKYEEIRMSDGNLSDDEIPVLVNIDQSSQIEDASSIPLHHVQPTQDLSEQKDEEKDLPPVPVTILSGFLGAGKTTLIQYILSSPDHGKKIAVIENEFSGSSAANASDASKLTGSLAEKEGLNIETLIARDGANDDNLIDLIELPNGCICCTVKDSLVETLEVLLEKKRELDYIIIECSGMANPGPIASIFWLDDALESRLRLDGIVTCVDARNIKMQLSETSSKQNSAHGDMLGGDEAAQQIAYADRIIVNKVDILTKESKVEGGSKRLKEVLKEIRAINSTAPIRTTTFSKIDNLSWILDANCFDADRAQDVEDGFEKAKKQGQEKSDNTNGCNDSNCASCILKSDAKSNTDSLQSTQFCMPCTPTPTHTHTNAITTIALIEYGSVCLKRMNTWLAGILWPDQDKEDSVLSAELQKLESLGQITTADIIERRKREEINEKMLIFRVKGVISSRFVNLEDVEDGDEEHVDEDGLDRRKYIVQAVNDLWEIKPTSTSSHWHVAEPRICKIVLIGRNLDNVALSSGFRECFL
jgi:G3E family GTPase